FAGAQTGLAVVHITRSTTTTYTGLQVTDSDDDHVHATASARPLVIFGGQGSDTIDGGTGGDIVFGDRGRVLWFNPATTLPSYGTADLTPAQIAELEGLAVVVAGHGGPGDKTDGVDGRLVGLVTTIDPRVGGSDTITT